MIGAVLLGNNLINILVSALATEVLTDRLPRRGRRRRRHRPDDRAGLRLRRGPAQDPGHHPAGRGGAPAVPADRLRRARVRACPLRRAVVRARHAGAGGRQGRGPYRRRWPPTRRSAARSSTTTPAGRWRAATGTCSAACSTWSEMTVGQVMVHRKNIAMLDADLPSTELIGRRSRTGHTRIPLYRGEPEDIVGFLHVRATCCARSPGRRPARAVDVARAPRALVHARDHQPEGPAERLPEAPPALRPGGGRVRRPDGAGDARGHPRGDRRRDRGRVRREHAGRAPPAGRQRQSSTGRFRSAT